LEGAAPTLPLITLAVLQKMAAARDRGEPRVTLSLDLGRSTATVETARDGWTWQQRRYPYPVDLKDRTIYGWNGTGFEALARFDGALYKLVPTDWGPPTFEIDGIKMLPTARVSPWEDAGNKVKLIAPRGKVVLDTCGGLGYFAAWCVEGGARQVLSFEKSPEVIWLRNLNPWSPRPGGALVLTEGDIAQHIGALPDASVDAILHDPPRFGIAGELYSRAFYDQLARVLRRKGRLFHYTGAPNRLTSGRDVPSEVAKRLRAAGFEARLSGDGVLARRP
jgi:predicted methyltransferase